MHFLAPYADPVILPIAVALWLGYKLVRGSRPTPPAELDLSADDVR